MFQKRVPRAFVHAALVARFGEGLAGEASRKNVVLGYVNRLPLGRGDVDVGVDDGTLGCGQGVHPVANVGLTRLVVDLRYVDAMAAGVVKHGVEAAYPGEEVCIPEPCRDGHAAQLS